LQENDEEISISKEVLQELPVEYEKTRLGEPRGSVRQYRGPSGLHIREYSDRFVIHRDRVDPRKDPIGHLLIDAPEARVHFISLLSIFLSLNLLLKFLKRLLF